MPAWAEKALGGKEKFKSLIRKLKKQYPGNDNAAYGTAMNIAKKKMGRK